MQAKKSSLVYKQSELVEYVNEIICHSNSLSIDLVSCSTVRYQHLFFDKVRLQYKRQRKSSHCLFNVDFGSMLDEITLLYFDRENEHTLI